MHLRTANHTLARLAAGIMTSVLALAAQSAFADQTTVTATPSQPAATPSTSSASSLQLSLAPSLHALSQVAAVAPEMVPTNFTDNAANASDTTAAAAEPTAPGGVNAQVAQSTAAHGSFLSGVASKAGDVVVGALNLIGVRYRWGGDSPDSGLDCSGFVRYIFQDTLNVTLPRTASDMSRVGEKVKFSDLKPGDLVFFNTARRAISHVGIYIGHDKFVHSPSTGSTIRVDEMNDRYWETRYRGARRLAAVGDGSDEDGTGSPADIAQRLQQASHMAY